MAMTCHTAGWPGWHLKNQKGCRSRVAFCQVSRRQPHLALPKLPTGQIAEVRVTSIPAETVFRFSPSSPAPADTGSVAAPRLVGIAGRSAYLRSASGETERLSAADELYGWSVTRTEEKSVTLNNGARSEQLKMFQ